MIYLNTSTFNANDQMSFKDGHEKHGLRGHVQIFRENKETGEKSLWYEDDNIIPISGYQWILMKMFGLYLDANHNNGYEQLDTDTNLIIPDLNSSGSLQIGVDPAGSGDAGYDPMTENIASNHFIQGFMVGTGGSGEDAITTKNTDYSFTKLRNPIPFQQTQTSLDPSIASKYLGVMRVGSSSFSSNYYIKKFDEIPHIYHSWWRDGQRWDYVDPVTQNDLGPDSQNTAKTNRIETYCQVQMSIDTDNGDCLSYFNHDSSASTKTAAINELGLVAFDAKSGTRSVVETCYKNLIKQLIRLVFKYNQNMANPGDLSNDEKHDLIQCASDILEVADTLSLESYGQSNINTFLTTVTSIAGSDIGSIDLSLYQNQLSSDTNIEVEAHYNQNGTYLYETDKFLTYMNNEAFSTLTNDEAQRIKLVTYYTFNAIPLQTNWKILINYRIYAN